MNPSANGLETTGSRTCTLRPQEFAFALELDQQPDGTAFSWDMTTSIGWQCLEMIKRNSAVPGSNGGFVPCG